MRRTNIREVRCRVTDRHTHRPNYSNPRCAEEQGQIIHSFATENGLKLNCEKTEVVKISQSNHHVNNPLLLADHIVEVIPHAVCLGYHWSHCLSARRGVEMNINKARRQAASLDTLLPWTLQSSISQGSYGDMCHAYTTLRS